MRIRNETYYRTGDLRKLFKAGFEAEGVNSRGYYIRVCYARQAWATGYGFYNSKSLCVRLPSLETIKRRMALRVHKLQVVEVNVKRVAQVFVHEVGHTLGLRHREMVKSSSIEVSWSEGMEIRKKEVVPIPKTDPKLVRFEHAKEKLREHEGKLRREAKLVRKWKKKVRYYERVFEKAAQRGEVV